MVRTDAPGEAPIVVPAADEAKPMVKAQAPLSYRVADFVARCGGERPASFRERIDYSLNGDWTDKESGIKRELHVLGTVLLCAIPGLLGALLLKVSEKPSRVVIMFLMLIIIGNIF